MHAIFATPELLASILNCLALYELLPCRAVARLWNDVVLDSPTFWAELELDSEDGDLTNGQARFFYVRLVEVHNRSRPVRVIINVPQPTQSLRDFILPALSMVMPIIVSLKLSINIIDLPATRLALSSAVPQLTDFDLSVELDDQYSSPEIPQDLFAGHAPQLARIWLYNVVLPPRRLPAFARADTVCFSHIGAEGHMQIARDFTMNTTLLQDLRVNVENEPLEDDVEIYDSDFVRDQTDRLTKLVVSAWLPIESLCSYFIPRIGVIASIGSPSLEGFQSLIAQLDGPLILTIQEDEFSLESGDGRRRWLEDVPATDPDFLREVMDLADLTDRVRRMSVAAKVLPALCRAGVFLPALDTLTLIVPNGVPPIGRGHAIRCPSMSRCIVRVRNAAFQSVDVWMRLIYSIVQSSGPCALEFWELQEEGDG